MQIVANVFVSPCTNHSFSEIKYFVVLFMFLSMKYKNNITTYTIFFNIIIFQVYNAYSHTPQRSNFVFSYIFNKKTLLIN